MAAPLSPTIHVIIPARNEQGSIANVIAGIPKGLVSEIIVVNNDSSDQTAEVAKSNGATVVNEPVRGYGNACLRGIEFSKSQTPQPDIVVFMDGDFSDYPEEMSQLIEPIVRNEADLVLGSRVSARRSRGSMTVQQIFGNWLATRLLRILFNARYTDLGPFRAIRFSSLLALEMRDKTYGWTVEMQLKAAKMKLRYIEVPVKYRKRIGVSKMAGYKILYTIFKYL